MQLSTIKIKSKVKLSVALLIFFCITIFLRNFVAQLRHLNYLVFPLALLFVFAGSQAKIKIHEERKEFFIYTIFWIAIMISSLLFNFSELSKVRFVKEFYFISASLISVVLLYSFASTDNIARALKYLLWLSLILAVVAYREAIIDLLKFNIIDFLVSSTSDTETILSYFIGVLALYFFLRKDKKLFLLSLFLVLISSKRAVYLGVSVCIIAYYFLKPFEKKIVNNRNFVAVLFTLLNLAIAYFIFLLVDGYFDDLIIQHIGVSPNYLFKGRVATYKLVLDYTDGLPLFPKGLGYTNGVLKQLNFPLELMHSDLLKYYIEFGIILSSCLTFLLYKMCARSYSAFIVLLYYIFNSLVGNITIYLEFMLIFYVVIVYFILTDSQKQRVLQSY